MLAAIDAIAARVGDDHTKILAALHGAYVTVAHATGDGEELLRIAGESIEAARRKMAPDAASCKHARTTRGADAPRLYGSWRTEVCRDCGAFRTHGHDVGRSHPSEWNPASEYAAATAEQELD